MIITNKNGIPEIIYKYLCNDFYDFKAVEGSYSATTLLRSVREIILKDRHNDELSEDAGDQLWKLLGSGVHLALEQGNLSEHQEERLKYKFGEYTISGKFDVIYDGHLTDFKVTSVYKIIKETSHDDWIKQLSIYRWLYAKVKEILLPDTASIITILRDWSPAQSVKTKNYPKSAIMEIPIKLMSIEDTEKMIREKLAQIDMNKSVEDDRLPYCSDVENWNGKKCKRYCACAPFCCQAREGK